MGASRATSGLDRSGAPGPWRLTLESDIMKIRRSGETPNPGKTTKTRGKTRRRGENEPEKTGTKTTEDFRIFIHFAVDHWTMRRNRGGKVCATKGL